jgi:hypothetical protein
MANPNQPVPVEYDAQTVFCYAEAFSKSAELLFPQLRRGGTPIGRGMIAPKIPVHISKLADTAPSATVDSFALELYLKCLHMMDHGIPVRGHDLKAIYAKLKPNTRSRLRTNYAAEVSKSPAVATMRKSVRRKFVGFQAYLNVSNLAFMQMRYLFEGNSHGKQQVAYWPLLRLAARKSVLDIMPDWA